MRAGIEGTLSTVVSEVLGLRIRFFDEGRQRDGRFCYSRSQKSQCAAGTVSYLKEHVASETDYPCERAERKYCDTYQLAQALEAFASGTAVETSIEAAYRRRGISAEVSIGRANAHNLSIIVKIPETDKACIQGELRTKRREQKLSSALGAALDVLSPTLNPDLSP
jgi:hypothetical protein